MKFCFDCDDTLYDLQDPFRKCVAQFFPNYAGDLEEFYRIYREYGDEVFDLLQNDTITVDDSGIYRIYASSKALGLDMDLEQAADFQDTYRNNQHHIQMAPQYHEYFKNTTSELAILTNGFDDHQRMKLKALDVFAYFQDDHVYTSGQLGFAKPDPRAFQAIADHTNTNISDWYYVGDNYINDMQGAKGAGMHTIHFNRHHQMEGDAADYIVYTEDELIELLKKLEK
ncbi:HAD family hydrolase [Absicoccus porci]|uniref:HAD family hydrolase n=1 Tax=Absicoccus porci TaxID=2486576 RepID=UPI00156876DF|nr:HAD family hydrolase [Absicoccus porci]MDD6460540.1 HAD family hydrolase [Absicoccus porci]MEE1354740.1 HAD family hydrolase [Absicoccus porci]